ncbi:MAG: hypothetical protein QM767_02970 [Anaeromyxobacter sp.]
MSEFWVEAATAVTRAVAAPALALEESTPPTRLVTVAAGSLVASALVEVTRPSAS